ncbi:MAG: thioredoxin domain-containing protein [Microscillaceae bacterium]|jgi:thioredoxin|nr:thioredoxin domain-containing protein [Microscillaceae bacterium]
MQNRISYFWAILFTFSIGFLACQPNPRNNENYQRVSAQDFAQKLQKSTQAQLLDVRTEGEFAERHLAKALNINYNGGEFAQKIAQLDKAKPTFVYCLSGSRSRGAAAVLLKAGFKQVYDLEGGILAWQSAGLDFEVAQNQAVSKGMSIEDYQAKLQTDKFVLVDFQAVWCAPCKKIKPVLYELAQEQKAKLEVLEIDVDQNPQVAQALKIDAIPQLYLYKNGKIVWEHKGIISKEDVLKVMD